MKKSEALKVLGLADGATDDEVKKAHREKVRENHPDRFTDPEKKAVAEDKTKLINEARDTLLSRKWDPEYGPRTGGYGNPYHSPYTTYRPGSGTGSGGYGYGWPYGWPGAGQAGSGQPGTPGSQGGNQGQVDWGGIPFTYVWTSWSDTDSDGVFDPWEAIFSGVRKTPEEQLEEAKSQVKMNAIVMAAKVIMLILCALTGNLAIGMFMFAIFSILYGFYHNHQGCGPIVILPLIMLLGPIASLFAPRAGVQVTGVSLVFFFLALFYDIKLARSDYDAYQQAKARVAT